MHTSTIDEANCNFLVSFLIKKNLTMTKLLLGFKKSFFQSRCTTKQCEQKLAIQILKIFHILIKKCRFLSKFLTTLYITKLIAYSSRREIEQSAYLNLRFQRRFI